LIGTTVITAELGRASLYRADGSREVRDSPLGRAASFVADPADPTQFFAHFADTGKVYVANGALAVVPYLAGVESFDVSVRYFASIERGSRLFVRRRDGGDGVPVTAGRDTGGGASVFVDDRAVYFGSGGLIDRLDFETGVVKTIADVTAV
jgi:hypothetical protein